MLEEREQKRRQKLAKHLEVKAAAAAKQQQKAAKEHERAKHAKEKAVEREIARKVKERQALRGRIAKICERKQPLVTKKARRKMDKESRTRYDSIVSSMGELVGGVVCDAVGGNYPVGPGVPQRTRRRCPLLDGRDRAESIARIFMDQN
ncbi:hypothetical protein FGB62_1g670 [Gracilaria domingensis]|nr:hypothetical protein FGB62_1g670 [Gracilaria domingensis]